VVELFVFVDGEGGVFFAVEGAEADPLTAPSPEGGVLGGDFDDGRRLADLFDDLHGVRVSLRFS
jgi:hypothetical protein